MKYSELYSRRKEFAAAFITLGLEKGDRIGIQSSNNVEWALTQFAAAMAELILVNIQAAYHSLELEYTLNKKQTFKHSNCIAMAKELKKELDVPGNLQSKRLPYLKSAIIIDNIHKKGFYNFQDIFSLSIGDHLHEVDK